MRQEFIMLADGAEATNGKIYILGGGVDRHASQAFPAALRADLAVGILVGWGETNMKHTFHVRVVDEDEGEAFGVQGDFVVGRPPQAKSGQEIRSLIAIRGPFPIPKPGAYKAVLELDDERQEPPFRFWVEQAGAPAGP
jgi:hypothetical protein